MMVVIQFLQQLHLQVEVVEEVIAQDQLVQLEEMGAQVVVELMEALEVQEIHLQQIHHKVTMEEDQIHQVVVEVVVEQPLQELQDRQQLTKVQQVEQEHQTQSQEQLQHTLAVVAVVVEENQDILEEQVELVELVVVEQDLQMEMEHQELQTQVVVEVDQVLRMHLLVQFVQEQVVQVS
jgi:hypothetical protein